MNKLASLLIIVIVFVNSNSLFSQEKKSEEQLINELIEKKRSFNKEFGYGFRIQLYNGFEVEAKKLEAKFRYDFPDTKTYLLYEQPEWKIQVGYFKTRILADRFLIKLKKKYRDAIVVPLGK